MMGWQGRFWAKVDKSCQGGCWLWTASIKPNGYGQFGMRSKTPAYAHRISYELHNGQIPSGLCVLHRCDNPPCVNPAHLFLGTQADNIADMISKGRNVDRRRLSEDQVKSIRSLAGSMTHAKIAVLFGIGRSNVGMIINRKIWAHL